MASATPRRLVLSCVFLAFGSIAVAGSQLAPGRSASQSRVDFATEVQPILSSKCYPCHGPDEAARKGKLRLDSFLESTRNRSPRAAITPNRSADSEIIHRVRSTDPDEVMPPPELKNPVTPAEAEVLSRWIQQGAEYAAHWAWIPPQRAALPKVSDRRWVKNGIDRFVASRLEASGLTPSAEADRSTLIRRLSLDLTGLPPSPDEVAAFVSDRRTDAYDRLVDRLLASPHFGERWARVWLDLARYADSAGYGSDPLRPNIWPWRDWLIGALNRNLPYDQFTRDLLAGDLVESATEEQRAATAFHRNTMTNTEGGTDDEEWRVAAVKDRVGVTAQVWMGLTMNCAQCHTHKFDPITQNEYYRFYALFNQTADFDQPDERPTMPVYSESERRRRAALQAAIDRKETELQAPNAEFDAELKAWAREMGQPVPWTALSPGSIVSQATNPPSFQVEDDRSIRVAGAVSPRDTYLLTAPVALPRLTALQIEVLPDPSLPTHGPGRGDNGAFVLSDVRLEVLPEETRSTVGRYVRLEAPGANRILSLAEVQVWSGGTNLALRGTAKQSTTGHLGDALRAIDGNTDGRYEQARSTTHTETEKDPWWEVDLGGERSVETIAVWNRTDGSVGERLANTRVVLLDANRRPVWQGLLEAAPAPVATVGPGAPMPIRLARASADRSAGEFPAAKAIDADSGANSGWSPGDSGKAHRWTAELAEPLELKTSARFRLTLSQNQGDRKVLGRFRVSVTDRKTPVQTYSDALSQAMGVDPDRWTPEQRRLLADHLRPESRILGPAVRELQDLRGQLSAIRGTALPVLKEVESTGARVTRVLNKGNFLDPGDPVVPGVPAGFHPWPAGAPTNRLGLVQWIMSPGNPLTARVAVNRTWTQLLGRALVETEEDFGTQGTPPTHRDLLDWLAVSYQTPRPAGRRVDSFHPELGWDFKALVKLIVTSATYRQSSVATPDRLEKDPLNTLYSRASRRRLDAEMVRDQALMLSGLLSRKLGGPSVYPAQPDGLWRAAFNGERSWSTSEGEDRYRRGIYTFWRRTVPYPSMATFDAPSRENCTVRRQPTNTPLQAFVTLNDPVFVECAQALGRSLVQAQGSVADRVRLGLERVLCRPASDDAVGRLVALHDSERDAYRGRTEEALRLATEPLGPLPQGLDPAEAAAWTTVANVLLNLDGVLMKN
jgi:Protein of unknown function (DUF1549)/Protein of unknown function (DUF1553)/Planctomycete cytochrome C